MSAHQLYKFIFQCDEPGCGRSERTEGMGRTLPEGWIETVTHEVTHRGMPAVKIRKHKCSNCALEVENEQ